VLESQWKRGQGESIEMAKRCMGGPGSVKGCFKDLGSSKRCLDGPRSARICIEGLGFTRVCAKV